MTRSPPWTACARRGSPPANRRHPVGHRSLSGTAFRLTNGRSRTRSRRRQTAPRGRRQATRWRREGAAHSRHNTTDEVSPPSTLGARLIRTTPLERQSRLCQHVRRGHRQGPEAAERAAFVGDPDEMSLTDAAVGRTFTKPSSCRYCNLVYFGQVRKRGFQRSNRARSINLHTLL